MFSGSSIHLVYGYYTSPMNALNAIGFIGAGQMAQALARGFVKAQLLPASGVCAYDPVTAARERFLEYVPGSHILKNNREVVEQSKIIILAVKPQQLGPALEELRAAVTPEKLFVSIAAGVTLATLSRELATGRIVRVMPNTPCLLSEGASAFCCGPAVSSSESELVARLLESVGIAIRVDEKLLDVVTGLSGSGPAYAFLVIEALADGAVAQGLSRSAALQLAAQTLRGAAAMVLAGEHPGVLKDRVASPGGTTLAGLAVLEQHGIRGAFMEAVAAATRRAQELGK